MKAAWFKEIREKLQKFIFPGGKLFLYDKRSLSGEDPVPNITMLDTGV